MHLSAALIFDSPMDIGVVLVIVLILFGGKKIPEVMRGLGEGIRSFKEGMHGAGQGPAQSTQVPPPAAPTASPVAEEKK